MNNNHEVIGGKYGIIRKIYQNGIIAVAKHITNTKKVYLNVGVRVGAADEKKEFEGISHFAEHMYSKSNQYYSQEEIGTLSEFNGISMNASTSLLATRYYASVPSDRIETALEILYKGIMNVDFNYDEFQRERDGVIMSEILMSKKNTLRNYYKEVLYPELYRNSGLQNKILGTKESLQNISMEDIKEYKQKYYVSSNIIIAAVGDIDMDSFFYNVEKTFGELNYKKCNPRKIDWEFEPRTIHTNLEELKSPSDPTQDQGYYFRVYKIPKKILFDNAAISFMNTLIGSGRTSLIFKKLRSENGIGYGPFVHFVDYEENGVFIMGIPGLHPKEIPKTSELIDEICEIMMKGEYSNEFFEGKKVHSLSLYESRFENAMAHTNFILEEEWGNKKYYYTEIPEQISLLTKDLMTSYSKDIFSKEPMTFLVTPKGYIYDKEKNIIEYSC